MEWNVFKQGKGIEKEMNGMESGNLNWMFGSNIEGIEWNVSNFVLE